MISTMKQNRIKYAITFLFGIFLLGCLIQAAGWIRGDRLIFPGVFDILRAFGDLLRTPRTYKLVWTTMKHLLEVIAASTVIGIAIGFAEGMSDFVRTLLKPTMILLRSIPMIVMIVIIMVLTKYDRVPLIASTLFLVPLISEAVCEGYRSIDRDLIDVYRLNGPFNMYVLTHVHLPLMAGYLKQAYVSAIGMGLKLVVSTEYLVQTRNSLGKAVHSSAYFNEYQYIYAYALIMIILAILVNALPVWIGFLVQKISGQPDEDS